MIFPKELHVEGIIKLGVLPQISNGSKIMNPPPILSAENQYSISPYSKLVIQIMIKDKNVLCIFIYLHLVIVLKCIRILFIVLLFFLQKVMVLPIVFVVSVQYVTDSGKIDKYRQID